MLLKQKAIFILANLNPDCAIVPFRDKPNLACNLKDPRKELDRSACCLNVDPDYTLRLAIKRIKHHSVLTNTAFFVEVAIEFDIIIYTNLGFIN